MGSTLSPASIYKTVDHVFIARALSPSSAVRYQENSIFAWERSRGFPRSCAGRELRERFSSFESGRPRAHLFARWIRRRGCNRKYNTAFVHREYTCRRSFIVYPSCTTDRTWAIVNHDEVTWLLVILLFSDIAPSYYARARNNDSYKIVGLKSAEHGGDHSSVPLQLELTPGHVASKANY